MNQPHGTRRAAIRLTGSPYPGAALAGVLLLSSAAAGAATKYFEISGNTAPSENGCPIWVPEDNRDDCSWHAADPFELGTDQWIGPVFTSGYYAPGLAPAIFSVPAPPAPVVTPAPVLPLGGKTGIPITRGFISVDDRGTLSASDDLVAGTIEFGAFERNLATGPLTRVVESFDRIIQRVSPVTVTRAQPNAGGGFDYVVANFGIADAYPTPLAGPDDDFPSEIASQSSPNANDQPYWSAAGDHGIARTDGTDIVVGTRSSATVWGYSCDDGGGPGSCRTTDLNFDGDQRAGYDNVLLRFSTDSVGNLTAAEAFLVTEADLVDDVLGNDSWSATTLSFSGTGRTAPLAFDDRAILISGRRTNITSNVLANDLPGTAPVTVEITGQPASGTATVLTTAPNVNAIQYTPATPEPPDSVQQIVYQVRDADDATATGTLQVLVTDAVACEDDTASGPQNAPVTIDVLDNDSGYDIPPVMMTFIFLPESGEAVINPDRSITFTPPENEGGRFEFTYRLLDGANQPVGCTVTVDIEAHPQAVDDELGAVLDTPATLDVLANDTGLGDTPLTLAITSGPAHGTATVDTSGTLPKIRYTPATGYLGADSLTYIVTDNDGEASTATASITVFGTPETDLPACTDDSATSDVNVSKVIDVLANDTGLNASPVTVTVDEVQPGGTAVVNPDNTITFTPPDDTGGQFGIAYTAREAVNQPVSCIVLITVDDLPFADDDQFQVNFGQQVYLQWATNDAGFTDVPIAFEITQQPTHGTVVVEEGDLQPVRYTYTDASGFPTGDIIRYRLRDADGDVSAEVEIRLTPVNILRANNDPDGFVTRSEDFRTATGYPVRLDVMPNDGGLLNGPVTLEVLSATHGTAVVNADNTVTFTPASGYAGAADFSYQLTDANGVTDIAAVQVLVYAAPETDVGGSSGSWTLIALLTAGIPLRRRLRRSHA